MKQIFEQIGRSLRFAMGFGFGAIWIGFWTIGTLGFDVATARSVWLQLRALGFPTADGIVTSSRVDVEHDSESGSAYTPQIEYQYKVARQEHRGNRLQYQW